MICTCGNQVASNASFCPKCGKRFTRKFVKSLAWFFGIAIGFGIIMALINPGSPSTPPSPAELQRKAKEDTQFQASVGAAKRLMEAMRNPASFKLSSALFMKDGAVCFEYHAENGFGGMNVGQAVLTPRGTIKTNEMEGYKRLWNLECAGKSGDDKTWEVNYGIGKESLLR